MAPRIPPPYPLWAVRRGDINGRFPTHPHKKNPYGQKSRDNSPCKVKVSLTQNKHLRIIMTTLNPTIQISSDNQYQITVLSVFRHYSFTAFDR